MENHTRAAQGNDQYHHGQDRHKDYTEHEDLALFVSIHRGFFFPGIKAEAGAAGDVSFLTVQRALVYTADPENDSSRPSISIG